MKNGSFAGAEEFRATASPAKRVWTNIFQALLVAVVVLWTMDRAAADVRPIVLHRSRC